MTAHVIAYARHHILTTARLLDMHRAYKVAKRTGTASTVAMLRQEINRRLIG